jgi:ABC-type multidrug transport system fused ATPase/permease subunit
MKPSQIFLRLSKYFLAYKWRILAGLLSVAIMSTSDTASAYLTAKLLEVLQTISQQVRAAQEIHVVVPFQIQQYLLYSMTIHGQGESFALIYRFALAIIIIIAVKVTFVYVREYFMNSVQQKILMRFRTDLFDRILSLPIRYFDEYKTGHIMSRVTNDVNNLEQSLVLMVEISQNIIYALVFATFLFYTNWQLTIVTLLIFTISGAISRKFGDRIRAYSHALTNTLADISAFLQERIAAIRIIKAFTREEKEKETFRNKAGSNYHFSMKIVRVNALLSPANELFNYSASSLLIIFCGYLFIQGKMSIETIIFFMFLIINLAKPVKALGESVARIQKTLVSAGYIFELLDLPPEQYGSKVKVSITQGNVVFKNISFA